MTYWLKIANIPYPCLVYRPRSGWPLSNFCKSFTDPKTRVLRGPEGKDLVILACCIFDTVLGCDGQTDTYTLWQTDTFAIAKTWHLHSMLLC